MKRRVAMILIGALALSLLTSCELMVPGPTERPPIGGATEPAGPGGPAPTESADPTVDEYGFTIFPEGNYLADPKFDTDEFLPGYDFHTSFLGSTTKACSTEDTFYFAYRNSSYYVLYYVDKAVGVGGPLCGRPECTHDSKDCNAWLGNVVWGLTDYNGRLYWVGRDSAGQSFKIFSSAFDGTDRHTVRELDDSIIGNILNDSCVLFHRGCLYWSCLTSVVVDGEAIQLARVFAFPLDASEAGYLILETEYYGFVSILPHRDSLYIALGGYFEGGVNGERELADRILSLYRWDIRTREAETLYRENFPLVTDDYWVAEDGIFFTAVRPAVSAEDSIYLFPFKGGKPELRYHFPQDVTRYFVFPADGMYVGYNWSAGGLTMLVKDFEGQTVLDTFIEGAEWYDPGGDDMYYMSFAGADEKYYYFKRDNRSYMAYAAVPLDGSEMKLLWSSDAGAY